jgi:hypothetical protein
MNSEEIETNPNARIAESRLSNIRLAAEDFRTLLI